LTALSSVIDLVHPTASGIGVILSDTIWVLFDREIDEGTVTAGNFFITGPDFDVWSGPDYGVHIDYESIGSEEEVLQSPGYTGIVQGTITYERISLTDDDTTVSGTDCAAAGTLYRTKATFTPTERLAADTEYTVYLSGDEDLTDSLDTGVSLRTVYDLSAVAGNASTNEPEITGSYTGSINDVFNIEITTTGNVGTARFVYWKDSDPAEVVGPLKTRRGGTLLSDGVSIVFPEGVYSDADVWTCIVHPATTYSGNLTWTFRTGSGSIATVPTTAATTVLGDAVPSTSSSSSTTFEVDSTDPADEDSHQTIPAGEFTIQAIFSDDIDSTTVSSGVSVIVTVEPVNGDPSVFEATTAISRPTVSGNTLNIVVASGEMVDNALVTITLDSAIASTGGETLSSDYEFWFTTTYSPYYCTLRKLRLDVGAFIGAVPDDTINLAIFEASLEADAFTWATEINTNYFNFVRGRYTCCKAAEILLLNATGGATNLKSKRLGDLAVEYDPKGANDALNRALACLEKFEMAVQAGGYAVQTPAMVVKGELDPDRPPTGRGWSSGRASLPAANTRYKEAGSRRYTNTYFLSRRGKTRYGN